MNDYRDLAIQIAVKRGRAEVIAALRGAELVLVAHQRRDSQHCLCGWGPLGESHAKHVADALADHLTDRFIETEEAP